MFKKLVPLFALCAAAAAAAVGGCDAEEEAIPESSAEFRGLEFSEPRLVLDGQFVEIDRELKPLTDCPEGLMMPGTLTLTHTVDVGGIPVSVDTVCNTTEECIDGKWEAVENDCD